MAGTSICWSTGEYAGARLVESEDRMERGRGGRDVDLALSGGNRIPAAEIVELASRSSGPGGQHVNTSSTRVTLRWNLRDSRGLRAEVRDRLLARLGPRLSKHGLLIVHADRHRSRERNREMARERLRSLVETALYQEPPRRPTRPTRASKVRRLDAKRHRGKVKSRRRIRRDEVD
jgi:ribosome-associated protein